MSNKRTVKTRFYTCRSSGYPCYYWYNSSFNHTALITSYNDNANATAAKKVYANISNAMETIHRNHGGTLLVLLVVVGQLEMNFSKSIFHMLNKVHQALMCILIMRLEDDTAFRTLDSGITTQMGVIIAIYNA